MQHYTFAVNAFVEMVKQFGMDEYEFAVHETKTYEVIEDVRTFRSEIGILYLNEFNRKVLTKLFAEYNLEFHEILRCGVYVYMWKGHPLANKKEIDMEYALGGLSNNIFASTYTYYIPNKEQLISEVEKVLT